MKWIGISGSWRHTTPELEADVHREVQALLEAGNGVVSGGALGVDYAATDLALKYAADGSRVKLYLPTTLDIYAAHYKKRAEEGAITQEQAFNLITQLETINNLGRITVNSAETELNPHTYYLRNTEVMNASDELLAFRVNQSAGTQDTIDKARIQGIPVHVFSYSLEIA